MTTARDKLARLVELGCGRRCRWRRHCRRRAIERCARGWPLSGCVEGCCKAARRGVARWARRRHARAIWCGACLHRQWPTGVVNKPSLVRGTALVNRPIVLEVEVPLAHRGRTLADDTVVAGRRRDHHPCHLVDVAVDGEVKVLVEVLAGGAEVGLVNEALEHRQAVRTCGSPHLVEHKLNDLCC